MACWRANELRVADVTDPRSTQIPATTTEFCRVVSGLLISCGPDRELCDPTISTTMPLGLVFGVDVRSVAGTRFRRYLRVWRQSDRYGQPSGDDAGILQGTLFERP